MRERLRRGLGRRQRHRQPSPLLLHPLQRLGRRVGQVGHERAQLGGPDPHARREQVIRQIVAKLGRGLVPPAHVAAQGLAHDPGQSRRDVVAVLVETLDARVAHHEQHVQLVRCREEPPAHERLCQHDADGKQVRAPVERPADDLLG